MIQRRVLPALLALSIPAAAFSLPLPPPAPQELAWLKRFFSALPKQLPPEDIAELDAYVSPDVKVYREGKLAFDGRDQWFAFLRSFEGKTADRPRGFSVSREAFYRTPDGALIVLEYLRPIPPKGKEAEIFYHETYGFTHTTYHLDGDRLVRVDYGPAMRKFDFLLDCAGKNENRSTDVCDTTGR